MAILDHWGVLTTHTDYSIYHCDKNNFGGDLFEFAVEYTAFHKSLVIRQMLRMLWSHATFNRYQHFLNHTVLHNLECEIAHPKMESLLCLAF